MGNSPQSRGHPSMNEPCSSPSASSSRSASVKAAPGKFEVKRHQPLATTTTTCLFPHTVILPQTSRELLIYSPLADLGDARPAPRLDTNLLCAAAPGTPAR